MMDDRAKGEIQGTYIGRVNRVMDYVRSNPAGDLRLDSLAHVASFSPYHFHRVFKAVVGETLNEYVRRIRAERAASLLLQDPSRTVTEVAVDCGYSSPSSFAREFRRRFGVSASQFRSGGDDSLQRLREHLEKQGQPLVTAPPDGRVSRTEMAFRVEVQDLPELQVAYVRHTGPYSEIGQAFRLLMRWAGPRRLLRFPQTQVLAIYHDNPDITPADRLRSDACITVPLGTRARRVVSTMTIPSGRFAVAHVEIDPDQYGEAWDRLLRDWMPQSGYCPDDRLCYERYPSDNRKQPQDKHIVDICEPIRPL